MWLTQAGVKVQSTGTLPPSADSNILANLGKVSVNTWYEVDVTSFVNGDGSYSLKVGSTNSDGAYYSTKEGATVFAPQLVITISR